MSGSSSFLQLHALHWKVALAQLPPSECLMFDHINKSGRTVTWIKCICELFTLWILFMIMSKNNLTHYYLCSSEVTTSLCRQCLWAADGLSGQFIMSLHFSFEKQHLNICFYLFRLSLHDSFMYVKQTQKATLQPIFFSVRSHAFLKV